MGTTAILMLVLGLIGIASSVGLGAWQGAENSKAQKQANETNLQLTREANAANAEQAKIAWRHSLPLEQVNNLMSAGLSRQGALASLTGGGTYTAPVMQSGHVEPVTKDYSQVSSALERLGNIPSSVQQADAVDMQRYALEVDTQNKINADIRAQEQHEFDMWHKLYGKDATLKLDNLSSRIVQQANEKGIKIDDIDTIDKLVKSFDLSSDKDFMSLPKYARDELFNSVRSQAAENREKQRIQIDIDKNKREETAAKDAHEIAEKHKTQLQQQIDDFESAKTAREKEYAEREMSATLRTMIAECGIAENELERSIRFYHDENGKLHVTPVEGVSGDIANFWKVIFNIVPIEPLANILSKMFVKH